MIIRWSLHAKDRFCERALVLVLNYEDIEYFIKEQKIKIKEKDCIKAFTRPIINAGRSLAIILSSDIVKEYNLDKGQQVKIIPQDRKKY